MADAPLFSIGRDRWVARLGQTRDVVRQTLVTRQLGAHLEPGSQLLVLDVGCGQGTQAIELARRGHIVTGIDESPEMLLEAERATAGEIQSVRERLRFQRGDALRPKSEHLGRFDVVCCHGVAMYLPSLEELVAALVAAAHPGGLVSLLTRNLAGIAMRAGMTSDWAGALEGFVATHYTNRLGIKDARADAPEAVMAAFNASGADTVAWYGVRLFTDHWGAEEPPADLDALLAAEEQAGRRDPYRSVAALTHTVAKVRHRPDISHAGG